ncbi:MAG: (2Fe-2S)-binding protein [Saprospiraceae bacterium]|nr:(2Fe-2S)-binding protein [Saprospiraceae bacterium]
MKKDDHSSNKDKAKRRLSRRGFIRGAGLTTAGTVVLQTGVKAFESTPTYARGDLIGTDGTEIEMMVNGRKHKLHVEPRTTLTTALRDHLGFTGTKVVCDRGACSACTVFLDGKPVNACMTMALDIGQSEVTTIEGVAEGEELHPVQEAFIEHDASQCGYCTPGMIMSSVHLLDNNANPTLDDVKHATRGNLCRCGTYPHVFKATMAAAEKMK